MASGHSSSPNRAPTPPRLPVSIEDDGISYFGPVSFDGAVSVAGSHEGTGNFLVEALAADGELIDQLINEVGEVETTTSFEHDGVGWVVVKADGAWTLSLE